MIYVIYPIMLVTLLWGSKRFKQDEWNEEAFSLRQMKAIQGFAALCITLQFYLIHGLFAELYTYAFEGKIKSLYYIKNPLLFVFVVFALGLASAVILKKGEDLIKGIGKRKRSV